MSNILFINTYINPKHGGVEKVTNIIATALNERGHKIYFAYANPDEEADANIYEQTCVGFENLEEFIVLHQITTIINQAAHIRHFTDLIKQIKKSIPQINIISCLHNDPTFLWKDFDFHNDNLINRIKNKEQLTIKNIIKYVTFPVYNRLIKRKFANNYRKIYNNSDHIVLLSEQYITPYKKLSHLKDSAKFRSIPNPITIDIRKTNKEKKDIALIVARLTEIKRINLAIDVWHEANKRYQELRNWELHIYGSGPCEKELKEQTQYLKMTNVIFKGFCFSPIEAYETAKIFLMTSLYEGWGLTLTESQSQGVIPIVFDTFLSLKDIVNDGINGCIIKNNDINSMAETLISLIKDKNKIQRLSRNAIISSQKFHIDKIVKQWENLIA